jgi:hypothetical protein
VGLGLLVVLFRQLSGGVGKARTGNQAGKCIGKISLGSGFDWTRH